MQTSAIRYRVVDFLKEYPPFQAMDEDDLLALVEKGRVRFHEIDEHVYWQGKPAGDLFFVVQQGAVSLYEEEGQGERLRDVRGPGDLLGIDRLLGRAAYRHSARAASDLILYGLPAEQMQPLLAKYPSAGRYLAAHASVSASYEPPDPWRRLDRAFAHDTSRQRPLLSCAPSDSVREAVRRMNEAGAGAIAVLSPQGTLVDILTSERVLQRLGDGTLSPERPVEALRDGPPGTVAPSVTVDQCLLAMVDRPEGVVALTDGGLPDGRVHALVTAADLGPVFGEEPLGLLHDLAHAPSLPALAALNQRVRRFVLQQLASPASVDWLSLLSCRFDQRLLARAISLLGLPGGGDRPDEVGWFFFGASGRAESMTPLIPQVGLMVADGSREAAKTALEWHRTLWEALLTCGYVGARELPPAGASFACASLDEWKDRFRRYVRDPIASAIYNARPLFDLRPLVGDGRLVAQVQDVVREEVKAAPAFVLLLANDCLTNMPPLAFFRNAVVEETGQKTETLHLWRSALLPLVDVGRVLALDGGRFAGEATLDRFAFARERHPSQESVFREAADSLRVMLYHNARAGIRRQDGGAEIDPASLSRYDRQILKSGFASIHRLLELMATERWRTSE